MALRRLQLFEFNDHPRAPPALREALVESLSLSLAWGHVLRGLAGPFASFVERTGATEVLDLCAGAGGPAAILAAELRRTDHKPPRFLLTDLHPHTEIWTRLQAKDPEAISFRSEPVDATAIPEGLAAGRPCTIINALHHLPPAVAGAVVRGACATSPGVFIAEGFERNPLRFWPMAPMGLAAMVANPWLTPRRGLAKFLLLPFSIAVGSWDGMVSAMRIYMEEDLRAMVAPLGDSFEWTWGNFTFPLGGRGYWFMGVRRHAG